MFIAIKTDDGRIKGKISFYCKVLHVSLFIVYGRIGLNHKPKRKMLLPKPIRHLTSNPLKCMTDMTSQIKASDGKLCFSILLL